VADPQIDGRKGLDWERFGAYAGVDHGLLAHAELERIVQSAAGNKFGTYFMALTVKGMNEPSLTGRGMFFALFYDIRIPKRYRGYRRAGS
jgi:hypothetical protein